jgi:hypothetical protein
MDDARLPDDEQFERATAAKVVRSSDGGWSVTRTNGWGCSSKTPGSRPRSATRSGSTGAASATPCAGEVTCAHFRGTRDPFGTTTRIQHGDDPEAARDFTAGVMPEGVCENGHDVALERWLFATMRHAGCAPTGEER